MTEALESVGDASTEVTLEPFDVDGIAGVRIFGEVDVLNAKHVRSFLESRATSRDRFIVSLERCGYFDSSGLSALVSLHRQVGDGLAVVVPPGAHVRRVITVTGLAQTMRLVDSIDEAVALLRR